MVLKINLISIVMIYNYEGFLDQIIDSNASEISMNTVKRKKGTEKYG